MFGSEDAFSLFGDESSQVEKSPWEFQTGFHPKLGSKAIERSVEFCKLMPSDSWTE